MTQKEAIYRWKKSAEKDLRVGRDMLKLDHYGWALFMGQLAIEKLLKGLVLKQTGETPPYIHDLVKLAKLAKLALNTAKTLDFIEITRFHVQARYEEVKYELYREATNDYTSKWFKKIEKYAIWIQKYY